MSLFGYGVMHGCSRSSWDICIKREILVSVLITMSVSTTTFTNEYDYPPLLLFGSLLFN